MILKNVFLSEIRATASLIATDKEWDRQSLAESGYNLISRQPKVVRGDAATWRQSEWTLDMEIMGIMTQIKECNKSKYWATKPRN